jgi:small conductance mechanosensitive channel
MNLPFLFPTSNAEWREWFTDQAPQLAGAIAAVIVVRLVARVLVAHLLFGAIRQAGRLQGEDPVALDRRLRTIEGTVAWFITAIVAFIATAVALSTFGVDVTPLVAGVGVVGIALGLGAQTLIKDVINGIFILAEDQYRVGDTITVAGVSGEVVSITPRRTLIRDGDGVLHTIPNGSISIASNQTSGFSGVNVDVPLALDEDLDAAMEILRAAARDIATRRPDDIVDLPSAVTVASIADGRVTVRVSGRVRPGRQGEIASELRRGARERLRQAGITLATGRTPGSA